MKRYYKQLQVIGTLAAITLVFFPNVAYAGIAEAAVKGFGAILNSISTGIASWMFQFLKNFILDPTDLDRIGPTLNYLIGYAQTLGVSLALYLVGQETFLNIIRTGTGQQTKSSSEILGKAIVSGVMIASIHFLFDLLIKINNYILTDVINIGVKVDKFSDLYSLPADPTATATNDLAILFLIFVLASLVLMIVGAIRYAEIAFMYVIAPILVAGEVSSDFIKTLLTHAIRIIFTQSAQVAILSLMLSTIGNAKGGLQYLMAGGFIVLLLRGPQLLRDYLYSTGSGGALVNLGMSATRFAAMKSLSRRAMSNLKPAVR